MGLMMNVKERVTKKKIVVGVVAAIILIGVIAIGVLFFWKPKEDTLPQEMGELYKEETVELGDIIVGVSEAGTASIVSETIEVDSDADIVEILVSEGEFVEVGTVLATVDMETYNPEESDYTAELEKAQISLTQLETEYITKKAEAENLYNKTVAAGENAQSIYNLAIQEIDNTYAGFSTDISTLSTNITELKAELTGEVTKDIETAEAEVATIESEIEALEFEISITSDVDRLEALNAKLEESEKSLSLAEENVDKAEDTYEQIEDSIDQKTEEKSNKEIEKNKYAASMATLKADAKASYNSSTAAYSTSSETYNNTLDTLDNNLVEVQEQIEEIMDAIEEEQEGYAFIDESGNVISTSRGYIMSIAEPTTENVGETERITGLIMTIADSTQAKVAVSISQDDIADIEIGMEANVVFDAYDDYTLYTMVDSITTTSSGAMTSTVNYTVNLVCELPEEYDMSIFQSMTATVTFVEKQVLDVICISNTCVETIDGNQYVTILEEDGTFKEVMVETGFSDGFDVEVISGLNVGDIVVIESAVNSGAY